MNTTPQNEAHAMTGLFPGDYFIHEFEFDDQSFFAYGLLRSIDGTKYHADYNCSNPPSQPLTASQSHRVVVASASGHITWRVRADGPIRRQRFQR